MVDRTLLVKAVGYKVGHRKEWTSPRIEDALREALSKAPTIAERHYPPKDARASGIHCIFINEHKDLKGGGLLFEICTYVHGHVPEGIEPDLSKKKAKVEAVNVRGGDGNPRELVHVYRCLAFGEILLVEFIKGGGGAGALSALLTELLRRHLERTHPALDLADIGSSDLRRLIQERGGVSSITARVVDTSKHVEGSRFAGLLSKAKGWVPGARKCAITWDNESGDLDEDASVSLVEEADHEWLAGVTLKFKRGGSVSDLTKYRERKAVKVQADSFGRPAVSEIETALLEYLGELRDPKRSGPITSDGQLKGVKLIGDGS